MALNLTAEQKKNADIVITELLNEDITNPFTIAALLSLILKESNLIPQSENLNYSKERLPEVWKVFSKTGNRVEKGQGKYYYNDLAVKYAGKPMELANFVYGNKNGNLEHNDGFLYRGRGFNQLTFKNNYKFYGNVIGVNLEDYPELANKVENAAKILIAYFLQGAKLHKYNLNDFKSLEEAIKYIYRENAGWGYGFPTTQEGFKKMQKSAPEFLDYLKKKSGTDEITDVTEIKDSKKFNLTLIYFVIIALLGYFYFKQKK